MTAPVLHCGRFRLSLDRPLVMGILNVTPDSFADGGAHPDHASALAHARKLIADGADIIDIGGESTRPGAVPVSEADELERVLPLVRTLLDAGVPISVDTRKPGVMREALEAGADMINDIQALRAEGALQVLADSGAAVCLMHMQGDPATMQNDPRYDDVVGEVKAFLQERVVACRKAGIDSRRIVIDPGFGFGKTVEHNVSLLRSLQIFTSLEFPVLIGLSRKGTLGALTGRTVGARMPASIGAALVAVAKGAAIVRVHDVAETVDALEVWNRCMQSEL
jgi:dihydropteroate synthase